MINCFSFFCFIFPNLVNPRSCKTFKLYSLVVAITGNRWITLSTACRLSCTTTVAITTSSCRWSRSWPGLETWLRTRPSTLSSTRSRSRTSVTQELMFDSGIYIGWKKVAEISQNYSNKEGCEKLGLNFACFNKERHKVFQSKLLPYNIFSYDTALLE